jgi:hypothetical protein
VEFMDLYPCKIESISENREKLVISFNNTWFWEVPATCVRVKII